MAEFRPAQPQLANWGGAFQKGFSSSVDAVQNKRDHALKLKTMAMAEERFGWDRKEQVRLSNVRKLESSFDAWEDPLKEMVDPWHEALGGKPAYFNDSYLENRFYSDDNKAKQYEIWQSDNSGNPEARKSAFEAKWKAGADAENAKIEQVIKNGLVLGGYTDEQGNPIRDKQIYSQLAISSKNVQEWAREYEPGIKLFDWRADMTTMDKFDQWKDDKLRPGTLTGDILGNTYAAPLAVAGALAGPAYLATKAYQKWGPGGASKDMASKVAEGKSGGDLKGPKHAKYVNDMTSKINDAEAKVKQIKDGLKTDGKKYAKTAAGKRAQASALKKANEAVTAANKTVDTYNRRVGAKQKIARTKTAKGFGKWFAPSIGGAVGSMVAGDKGEAVGSGAGGAYLMKDAAIKGGSGLTKFVLTKLGQRVPAAIAASAMDGPLPFGELLSLGIGAWTIWSAIKEYNALK